MAGWSGRLWRGKPVRAVERIPDGREADERVLDHLAKLGCDPGAPRETTHYLYVPRETGAAAVATVLGREGWRTRIERCGEGSWLVVAARACALTSAYVRETRRALETLAAEHGGIYDGWEAEAT
jgi:hypothetical protein